MGVDRLALEAEDIRKRLNSNLGTRYVFGEGDNPEAFIVGEAPGAQEEAQGRPFVGPCAVLRELMELADLRTKGVDVPKDRYYPANAWLTNVVKFRPPRNRTPTDKEIQAFRGLLLKEWRAVGQPRLIIPVGGVALQAITGKKMSILRAAGKCHYYRSKVGELAIWPMVHPSFVIRQNSERLQELVEADWERLGVWRNDH